MIFSTWLRNWKRSLDRRYCLHQTLRRKQSERRHAFRPRLEVLEDRYLLSAYVVTNTSDDPNTGGSLPYALNLVNTNPKVYNEIDFQIGTLGSAQTINLSRDTPSLPTVFADNIYINGLSQGGPGNTQQLITINGFGAARSPNEGIVLAGSNCTVSGLILENFNFSNSSIEGSGIKSDGNNNVIGGTAPGAGNILLTNQYGIKVELGTSGTQILGNYIGINPLDGTVAANSIGIDVLGPNNTIGGAGAARNVISGNSHDGVLIESSGSNNFVSNNYIGTSADGSDAVANGGNGIEVRSNNNTIGGAAGNLISGNSGDGVLLASSGNLVLGNSLGVNAADNAVVANGGNDIEAAGNNNTIGGTVASARNIISGSSNNNGVLIDAVSGTLVQGNYIDFNNIGITANGNGNTIGGSITGAGNLISKNASQGVLIGGSGNQVLGNLIGTDSTGANAMGNDNGIEIGGSGNTIGGTVAGAGNLISGNNVGVQIDSTGSGNQVLGNSIGTDITGAKAVANYDGLYVTGNSNTVGGSASGAGNLISGNSSTGVFIASGSGNQVLGNSIGTNAAGKLALANDTGIWVEGVNNTVGGAVTGAGNLISGNSGIGVEIYSNSGTGNQVLGNTIGVNAAGSALSNGYGIYVGGTSNSNTIGGTATGAGNLVSGNASYGVFIDNYGNSNQVLGNTIGANAAGRLALPNGVGIYVDGANNTVGGTSTGAGNLVSGNSKDGVLIDKDASGNQLLGNLIGSNLTGNAALPNSGNGIEVAGVNNMIGSTIFGAGNLISGNSKDGVLIDSGSSGNLMLGNTIGANSAGSTALPNGSNGVELNGINNTVGGAASAARNLISGNSKDGVLIDSDANNNQVLGNYIGINAADKIALPNSGNGLEVNSSGNTIGGTVSGAGNVISGNTFDNTSGLLIGDEGSGNQVLGNSIGVDGTGKFAVPNLIGLNVEGANNIIGGTVSGAGNVISGNTAQGVGIGSSGNQVLGNFIGTDVTGKIALSNSLGIGVGANNNTIGGTVAGAGNLISGNSGYGLWIFGGNSNQVLGNSIGINSAALSAALGNGTGILVQGSNNTIGGTVAGQGNIISGNSNDGVSIGRNSSGNQVLGNSIGTNAAGTVVLGNGTGIEVGGSSNAIGGAVSGAANLITNNSNDGVLIDRAGSGNQVLGNSILANGGNGIETIGSSNSIGGVGSGAANLISGNKGDGVLLAGSGNQVLGNSIGVDDTGKNALANSVGINVEGAGNTIGGTVSGAANLISGNKGDGVLLLVSGNQVLGNYIGTDATGKIALANSVGIEIGSSNNTIGGTVSGAANLISGNSKDGVLFGGAISSGNRVLGNFIGVDTTGKRALPNSIGIEDYGTSNTIGGTVAGAGNVISGNSGDGMFLAGSGNRVLGNYIGIDAAGKIALANSVGIEIGSSSDTIGGAVSGAANFISGNSTDGVKIDSTASGTAVQGNSIGLNVLGAALGNSGYGVSIAGNNNSIGGSVAGAGNSIDYNKSGGVLVSAGSGNAIRLNSIAVNGNTFTGPGITLSSGANNNVAAPSLSSAMLSGGTLTVKGTFTAPTANVNYVLDFYANYSTDPEGKVYAGSLTVTPTSTGSQAFTFTTTTFVIGTTPLATATLTDAAGNTSAFSSGVTIVTSSPNTPPISPPPVSPPSSSPPPSNSTPSNGTTPQSPLETVIEVALATAASLLQDNAMALQQLEWLSVMFLGESLPPTSELLSSILNNLSVSGIPAFFGLQLGINIADSVNDATK